MIYTEDAVFIHVPKTGGMSVTQFLANALDCPVTIIAPENARTHDMQLANTLEASEKLGFEVGLRHETCEQAVRLIQRNGWPLPSFAFAMIRDPVDMLLSFYKQMRKPHVWQREGLTPETLTGPHRAAMRQTFDQFARRRLYYDRTDEDIMGYYKPSGFARLDIVPLNHITEYLALRFGHHTAFSKQPLAHRNRSTEVVAPEGVAPETRRHIYNTYPQLTEAYFQAMRDRIWETP